MPADASYINAPVPGMSLTTEPGNRPWESPPSLSTVEDAMEFYTKRILGTPENHDEVLNLVESGLPVRNIASILQKTSVMQGIHSIDVGILVLPVIEELIMAVADEHNTPYVENITDILKENIGSQRQAKLAVQEMLASKNSKTEVPVQEQPKKPTGLMAKPMKDMVE
jgi:hypothetical protein